MYGIQYAGTCQKGNVRKINQDNIVSKQQYLPECSDGTIGIYSGENKLAKNELFGVFDGIGGGQRGEAASYIAAKTAAEWNPSDHRASLLSLCRDINRRICEYTEANKLNACGTTAAMLLLDDNGAIGCNIGDSRIYQYRNGKLIQLSEDHVLPAFQGQKAPLLQFLGIPENEMFIQPTIFYRDYMDQDLFLLCSDGLTDMLPENLILNYLSSGESPNTMAQNLLDSALSFGGKDNISFFLIRICEL